MEITIQKLTPALAEDYVRFFDTTPHSTNLPEHRCYCVCWCSADYEGTDFSTAEKRREAARSYVKDGSIQGYLAYRGGEVVGWCNANTKADCYACCSWRMFMGAIERDAADVRVKSVFCFAIAPELRGKGVAKLLLERVCADADADGFDCIEAYPNKVFVNTEEDFMGPVRLYEKAGFAACYEAGQRLVMRKYLSK